MKISAWKEELLGALIWACLFIGLPLVMLSLERIP